MCNSRTTCYPTYHIYSNLSRIIRFNHENMNFHMKLLYSKLINEKKVKYMEFTNSTFEFHSTP